MQPINLRSIVAPWGIFYQSTLSSLVVTDHGNQAIKMIRLDASSYSSKVITMTQSYLEKPTGISMTRSGDYVITDTGSRANKIGVYCPTSNYVAKIREFGAHGDNEGEILNANYVTVDHQDRVIVSDWESHHVKVFSTSGQQLLKFSCCASDGKEMSPQGLAIDDSNNILVADQSVGGVTMYSPDGQLIGTVVNTKGSPWGISYLDQQRMLAVTTDKGLEMYKL